MEKVITASIVKQDSDYVERERRKKNIVVKNIPESKATGDSQQRREDRVTVMDILGIEDEEDVMSVWRAGPPIGSLPDDNRKTRPVIVMMKTPELAKEFHGYSSGRKYVTISGAEYYANPDLIQADRIANYNARQLRKKLRGNVQANLPADSEVPKAVEPKVTAPDAATSKAAAPNAAVPNTAAVTNKDSPF